MNFKLISGLIITCLILVLIIQNIATVDIIRIFFWKIEISLVLLILILLGIGLVAGWLLNDYFTYRKKIKSQMKPQE